MNSATTSRIASGAPIPSAASTATTSPDLRVAFGEGWGNAFSGMVLGNPIYRDSQQGVQGDFAIDMETDSAGEGVLRLVLRTLGRRDPVGSFRPDQ